MVQWQIFLSFRGEDTRYGFTGHLYDALCRGGFNIFMDDGGGLQNGDQISSSLSNAIEASRLSIVILSENYASSTWCLDELVKILECKKSKNQLVWPIFYKVEPSNIRKLANSYGESMTKHEQQFGSDSERLQIWRSALFEVSNLSGQAYKIGSKYEYKFIKKIVKKVIVLVKDDIEIEKNKLISNLDLLHEKVATTRIITDDITEKVSDFGFKWLNDTQKLIQEVENMMEQARTQHVQQDEFMKLLEKVVEQNIKYSICIIPIPTLEHFSSGNIVCFESGDYFLNDSHPQPYTQPHDTTAQSSSQQQQQQPSPQQYNLFPNLSLYTPHSYNTNILDPPPSYTQEQQHTFIPQPPPYSESYNDLDFTTPMPQTRNLSGDYFLNDSRPQPYTQPHDTTPQSSFQQQQQPSPQQYNIFPNLSLYTPHSYNTNIPDPPPFYTQEQQHTFIPQPPPYSESYNDLDFTTPMPKTRNLFDRMKSWFSPRTQRFNEDYAHHYGTTSNQPTEPPPTQGISQDMSLMQNTNDIANLWWATVASQMLSAKKQ